MTVMVVAKAIHTTSINKGKIYQYSVKYMKLIRKKQYEKKYKIVTRGNIR